MGGPKGVGQNGGGLDSPRAILAHPGGDSGLWARMWIFLLSRALNTVDGPGLATSNRTNLKWT